MIEEENEALPDLVGSKKKEIQVELWKAPIPRHIEIKNSLCILIRKQLAIK